ncbi:MAG: 50S ribosomal protein L6 [Promethearchaeota archaeon]
MKHVLIDEELEIPSDVKLSMDSEKNITVKGKKGELTKSFAHAKKISISILDNKIYLHTDFPRNKDIALVSTLKNLLINMIIGVQEGYVYKMKIVYSHFPITVVAPKKGQTEILIKNFIGERAPRVTHAIGDVSIKTNKEEVIVSGVDKETVGQTCANIQRKCRIKEKDKRVFQDGVYVYEKMQGNKQIWAIR